MLHTQAISHTPYSHRSDRQTRNVGRPLARNDRWERIGNLIKYLDESA